MPIIYPLTEILLNLPPIILRQYYIPLLIGSKVDPQHIFVSYKKQKLFDINKTNLTEPNQGLF